ncbi:hypothetical protein AJ80_04295 [Polytolypa hystricis UAMH7299]|uniref:NTF2 domain-containing protein n=1 Tax=Polytolypa hystricis (strain UAMH7299) TaxID=1447883 RepID=A0A2B7YDJ3_POLH7|nr:hypothetical protein AJ80_04295 [Polytolypa hystricis UAMH7299]
MAAETTAAPVNGTYHAHHQANPYAADPYNPAHAATNSMSNTSSTPASAPANEPKNDISKDEVGWFFVEQYYTTLSRSPEKLHLFYSRKSQFVSGAEAEKVPVAVGQKSIGERIKELDFQDCKVRVLNVDSQASFLNILVSVIGEISNKSLPPRKFVQTFVLAEQPNGYYVLNDIIRYLADEDEEIVPEEVPVVEAPAAEEAPVEVAEKAAEPAEPAVEDQVDNEAAAEQVDDKLEEAVANGVKETAEEEPGQVEEPAKEEEAVAPAAVTPVPAVPAVPAEPVRVEEPKEPESTPAEVSPPKAAAPVPVKQTPPPKPMSWASIAASRDAAAAAARAAAAPVAVPAPAPSAQPKPAAAPAPAAPQAAASPAPEAEAVLSQSSSSAGSEWQTAGGDHGRRQARPHSISAPEGITQAYMKNVTEKVDASLLKQVLSQFGKLAYFDVNRMKNCAFIEFADPAGYKAAVAANPHQVGTEMLNVEERRLRPYAGRDGYGPGRGGAGRGRGGDGRPGSQGRGGFQKESGRFATRGRGGSNLPSKGRSQPQAA